VLALAIAVVAMLAGRSRAEEVVVPVPLQAELLAKVASYDRNFARRAHDKAKILLVARRDDPDSTRFVAQMRSALGALDTVGGVAHEETTTTYDDAASLAKACREGGVAVVYFGPGLSAQADAIAAALDGVDVLSVAATADLVPHGIVLGFDLVSGKPKLLVHLGQARKQNVALKSDVLKLAKVFE
jgi:hypothetical protein